MRFLQENDEKIKIGPTVICNGRPCFFKFFQSEPSCRIPSELATKIFPRLLYSSVYTPHMENFTVQESFASSSSMSSQAVGETSNMNMSS